MSTAVVVLRVLSLVAFVAPLLLGASGRRRGPRPRPGGGPRVPLVANLIAFGAYFPSLLVLAASPIGSKALVLAAAGFLLTIAGGVLVFRARTELGPAWSLVPRADQGLVTTGPYRLVRHPIYLGFSLLTTGTALAFGSWPAFLVVVFGIVPTFAWRARAEEILLGRTLGETYAAYRQRTRMIIPYLL